MVGPVIVLLPTVWAIGPSQRVDQLRGSRQVAASAAVAVAAGSTGPSRVAVRTARTRLAIPPSFHPGFKLFYRQEWRLMTPAQAMAPTPGGRVTYE